MYLDAQDEIEAVSLKRKTTASMYSIADLLRPPQFHCGRSSLSAAEVLKQFGKNENKIDEAKGESGFKGLNETQYEEEDSEYDSEEETN